MRRSHKLVLTLGGGVALTLLLMATLMAMAPLGFCYEAHEAEGETLVVVSGVTKRFNCRHSWTTNPDTVKAQRRLGDPVAVPP